MSKRFYILLWVVFCSTLSWATSVYTFPTDSAQRGYYNRPYERYEAEPDYCVTNGVFLASSDNQADLQSEASHQQALQLVSPYSYVQWQVHNAGDGFTIRFSLPDGEDGLGTKGNIAIYADNEQVGAMQLDSYWAWQYTTGGGNYPTNKPVTAGSGNVVRMRFDEMHLRLSRVVKTGETLRIVKTDANATPYTIDFVELEPVPEKVTFESLTGDKVQYDGSDMQSFITANPGKIIYFPEGKWTSSKRLYLTNSKNTQLIGAGMWYTEIYFDASSDSKSTYSYRGIEASSNNLRVEGLYLNTINNKRYYNNNDSYQVGKGFQGSWGTGSVIRNCWVEHFECGAWIANYGSESHDLLIEHCRFRNNYADGVNCAHGTRTATVRYCSFRNNGDDDMASWSDLNRCVGNTFAYCTTENNWRASSLGFFGGEGHTAHHLFIVDGLECGARVNADFGGCGFSETGNFDIHDITIQHCGCQSGTRGNKGDFWGYVQGALNIGSTNNYAIYNIYCRNIEIVDARSHAIMLRSMGNNLLNDIRLENITIRSANDYGIYINGGGTVGYCNLQFKECEKTISTIPSTLTWTELTDCATPIMAIEEDRPAAQKFFRDGALMIRVGDREYDILGR